MARTNWQYNEIVTEADMNQLGQQVNAATQGVQDAKSYTDQQIALVTATGISKLVTYPYVLTASQAVQTDFEIPLETFIPETDTVIVVQNSTVLSTDRFSIISPKTVRLAEGVKAGTQIFLQVWKNVPIGPEGAISAAVLANGTVSKEKLGDDVKGDYVRQPGYIDPTSGTNTAYTGGTNPPLLAYSDGVWVTIVPHVDCGNNPTFNWDQLGAIALSDAEGNQLMAGDLKAGIPYTFRKKGNFILQGKGGINQADKASLITIANEAEANNSAIKADVATKLQAVSTDVNLGLSSASTWTAIQAAISSVKTGKRWKSETVTNQTQVTVTNLVFIPSKVIIVNTSGNMCCIVLSSTPFSGSTYGIQAYYNSGSFISGIGGNLLTGYGFSYPMPFGSPQNYIWIAFE